jgi:hypothetical protein
VLQMADRKTVVQVKHRLRRDLLQRIVRSAKATDRSVNEEIEWRLEQSFRQEERAELIAEAINRVIPEAMNRMFKVFENNTNPATWSPEMRAWAAQQPGLLGLAGEQPATDKKEDSK